MKRDVQPELLDTLPPQSYEAVRSRKDLRRINRMMGHAGMLFRTIRPLLKGNGTQPWRVADLGSGDARLTASLWRRLPIPPVGSTLTLLDHWNIADPAAVAALERKGWQVEVVEQNVMAWLEEHTGPRLDLIYANLFIHHFDSGALQELLNRISTHAESFVALEPRRSSLSQLGAYLIRWIGCHPVTQIDANRSVLAGFCENEVSRAWGTKPDWRVHEEDAGFFSHRFLAVRVPGS